MKNHSLPSSQGLVPDYIRNLQVYQAGRPISEVVREKGLTKVSKLASNENPLGPSPFAIREMTRGLWDLHRYPDMHAHELKGALAQLYRLKRENIILGNGSEDIMSYIVRAFLGPEDELLTSEKTFVSIYILSRAVGAIPKTVPMAPGHRYDVEALARAITPRTKIIYICNPNNPTGTFITRQEFDYLMEHVPARALVLLDEAYFEFAQGQKDYPDSMEYRYDNVITLRTFSKAYGLAGIRVGYGFGHEELIGHMHKVKLPFGPNIIAQLGAVGALGDRPHLERTVKNNAERYPELFGYLANNGLKPIPSVANFIAFPTGSAEAAHDLFQSLLDEGVIVRHLAANEMPDYVRVSLGTPEEMQHFFAAMDKVLPAYRKRHRL